MKRNHQKHFETMLSKLIINTDASFLISCLGRALWLKSEISVYKFYKINSHVWKIWQKQNFDSPRTTDWCIQFSFPLES